MGGQHWMSVIGLCLLRQVEQELTSAWLIPAAAAERWQECK
jgi:hypothetical protein